MATEVKTQPIDWTKPIEFVSTSRGVVPCRLVVKDRKCSEGDEQHHFGVLYMTATGREEMYWVDQYGMFLDTIRVRNQAPKPVQKNYWAVTYLNHAHTLVTVHLLAQDGHASTPIFRIGDDYKSLGKVVHVSEFTLAL